MAGYIVLQKFTPQGIAKLKELPEIVKGLRASLAKDGIKLVGWWMLMGEYDAVSIVDAPDDQIVAARVLRTAMHGLVTTQTMRAFSEEEMVQVLAKLP
jgi:uncharacterized protein with GYD domain